MNHSTLSVATRNTIGNSVRILRRNGLVPAVLYNKTTPSISVEVKLADFLKVYKESGKTHVLDISVDGKTTYPCIVHDLDVHPVTGKLRHADLLIVNLKEKVVASVPINYVGESRAVKEEGGILNATLKELLVESLPDNIPSQIDIDLSLLDTFEDVIRVSDVKTNDSYSIKEDSETVLASITSQTTEVADQVEASTEDKTV